MKKALLFLNEHIHDEMDIDDMLKAFEKMCNMRLKNVDEADDLILFETGTYSWTGNRNFNFH